MAAGYGLVNLMTPHVSVCVCTFNGAQMLGRAVDSILAQSFRDFELLIVDDASTDDTRQIANQYRDRRVRVVGNPQNVGQARNRSQAIQLSRGELIKFVDQDDWIEPSCLEEHVRCMEANPTVGLTFSRCAVAFEQPDDPKAHTPEADWWLWWPEQARRMNATLGGRNAGGDMFSRFVEDRISENWVGMPTAVMLRKSCLRCSGLFSRRLRLWLDLDLWLRVMAFCDVGYLDQQLATIWVGHANETRAIRAEKPDWLDRLWMLEGLRRELPDLWRRYPELAELRRTEMKSIVVATITGRYRATRLSDALRGLADYAAYRLHLSATIPPLYDSL